MAMIGSIVSLILMFKYVVLIKNKKVMEKYLVDQIISFYYPEFLDFKVKTNLGGKVTDVSLLGKHSK
jgi:hypothetical protein